MRRRRHIQYVVITGMLITGLYTTASGLLAGLFGFPQFFLHRWSGYACAALVAVHLGLNWRRVTAYLRHVTQRRQPPATSRMPAPAAQPAGRRTFIVGAASAAAGLVLGWLLPRRASVEIRDLGQAYHQWSKPGGSGLDGLLQDWGPRPATYKVYGDAPRAPLPDPSGFHGLSTGEAIRARRSRRDYVSKPVSLEQLSVLLHAAQGITDLTRGFRAAPSAGALYPIETYVVAHRVEGLEPGLYHYAVADHALERLRTGDLRAVLTLAGIGQEFLATASVCFVLSAIFQRTRWRYRERTYRYVLLEAGHIAQNLYLAATAMGLGACAVGAFLDEEVNRLLGIDGEDEAALYMVAVGKPAS